jgi:hypothetical protein
MTGWQRQYGLLSLAILSVSRKYAFQRAFNHSAALGALNDGVGPLPGALLAVVFERTLKDRPTANAPRRPPGRTEERLTRAIFSAADAD